MTRGVYFTRRSWLKSVECDFFFFFRAGKIDILSGAGQTANQYWYYEIPGELTSALCWSMGVSTREPTSWFNVVCFSKQPAGKLFFRLGLDLSEWTFSGRNLLKVPTMQDVKITRWEMNFIRTGTNIRADGWEICMTFACMYICRFEKCQTTRLSVSLYVAAFLWLRSLYKGLSCKMIYILIHSDGSQKKKAKAFTSKIWMHKKKTYNSCGISADFSMLTNFPSTIRYCLNRNSISQCAEQGSKINQD